MEIYRSYSFYFKSLKVSKKLNHQIIKRSIILSVSETANVQSNS